MIFRCGLVKLLCFFVLLSYGAISQASWDGTISLRSNKNAKYFIDDIPSGVGKSVEVQVNPFSSHKIVAKIDNYKDKVEYVQANYPRKKIGFIFLSDDKIPEKVVPVKSIPQDTVIGDDDYESVKIDPSKPSRYRALIIANSNYLNDQNSWSDLKTPVTDASKLKDILETNYGFVDTIFVENATRSEFYKSFKMLLRTTNSNDNVLVFYAGHGYFDNDEIKTGYWIPVDADGNDESTLVSNEDIKKRLSLLSRKAGHVLMVSDSCFSGNFLNRGLKKSPPKITNKYYQRKNRLKSAQILTSGGNEYVDDQYSDSGHSPFAYFLLRSLQNNDKKHLSTTELALHLEKTITNSVGQTPRHGSLKSSEDEGGEFFFVRKN